MKIIRLSEFNMPSNIESVLSIGEGITYNDFLELYNKNLILWLEPIKTVSSKINSIVLNIAGIIGRKGFISNAVPTYKLIVEIFLNSEGKYNNFNSLLYLKEKAFVRFFDIEEDHSLEAKEFLKNFGIDIDLILAQDTKTKKKVRLTRRKLYPNFASSMTFYLEPDNTTNGTYWIDFENMNLEEGSVKNRKRPKDDLSKENAIKLLDKYIAHLKSQGYVDKDSSDYIPVGANSSNWDFEFNRSLEVSRMEESTKIKEEKEMEEMREIMASNKQYKVAQDFQGYFSGNVPDYAAQMIGTSMVDASQVRAMFGRADDAIRLVNQFDSSLLLNVSFIFNFSKSGAYGVYLSSLDRAIKTKVLKKKLESMGYKVEENEKDMLTAYPTKQEKTPEQIDEDIKRIYGDLESKGGTAFGINVSSILSAAKQDAMQSESKDPKVWEWMALLHLGGTIVHEAIHAKGSTSEGPSEASEQKFLQWALPIVNEEYKRSLISGGKEEEFYPLIITQSKRHASNDNWYKEARILSHKFYNKEIAKNTKDPNILINILKEGNNDDVSYYAAINSSVPPELSAEILRRGNDDLVSRALAGNPSTPPEVLVEVLKRGDYLSRHAALNTSMPPEALAEVLRRGKNDDLSICVALNPSTPPEALVEVLTRGNDDKVSQCARQNLERRKLDKEMEVVRMEREKIEQIKKQKELEKSIEEEKELARLREIMASNDNWYKTAQNYTPNYFFNSPTGSDLQGRMPKEKLTNNTEMADWSMIMQQEQGVAIENKLGRQYMSPIPKELDQEHNSIEEQLRKYTKNDEKLDSQSSMEELLSAGHDKNRGYLTIEELLGEKRIKPLMLPLKKASMNKVSTLFGWMNNLDISDGSTIPGLSDRVMSWESAEEDFKFEEDEIRQQPRYNPSYDIKGFYYRWVEPRFRPQLWDDMASDNTNISPAKRFASKEVDPDISKILNVLSVIKSKMINKEISNTRLICSDDIVPLIEKAITDFRILVFPIYDNEGEKIYAVWICDSSSSDEDIEKAEKILLNRDADEDNILDKLFGLSAIKGKVVDKISNILKKISNDYNIRMVNNTSPFNLVNVVFNTSEQAIKFGEMVAKEIGTKNIKLDPDTLSLCVEISGINVCFKGDTKEEKNNANSD
jgi:hypothetical protein